MGNRVFLSLGSNIGDRRAYLRSAVSRLVDLVAVSPLYETEPVGGPKQDDFLNIVVELNTNDGPEALLELCQRLETEADRVRLERWGPRSLDVDILVVFGGDELCDQALLTVEEPDLSIPHPRMFERNFVMKPLLDLAPEFADLKIAERYNPDEAYGAVVKVGAL